MLDRANKISYLQIVILIIFNWIMITSMPFLQDLRGQMILEFVLMIPLLKSLGDIRKIITSAFLVICYIFAMLVTSITTKSFTDFYMWESIISIIVIMLFCSNAKEHEVKYLINGLYISINVMVIISLIGILIAKYTDVLESENYTIAYTFGNFVQWDRFYGVLNSCNTLGPLAGTSCIISIFNIEELAKNKKQRKKLIFIHIVSFIINLYVLIGTSSITALTCTTLAITTYALLHLRKHKFATITALILIGIVLVSIYFYNESALPYEYQRNWETASNRTTIWDNASLLIKQHPLTGYGSKDNYLAAAEKNDLFLYPQNTHNMFVEVLLRNGIITGSIFILSFLLPLCKILYLYVSGYTCPSNITKLSIAMLLFMSLHSIFEAMFFFNENPMMIIFQLFYILCIKHINLCNTDQKVIISDNN